MSRLKLSADVLKLNPGLAAQQAKSKALTPSGRGHGHTDDANEYDPPKQDRRAILAHYIGYGLTMMDTWGLPWVNTTEAATLRVAIRAYLRRLGES